MLCESAGNRIETIHSIRGLAALLVTCFHMVNGNMAAPELARMFAYGYLGVEMFFVISGFILPYS
jgi:peptidoglycan/LPS O-acetylase OafA/YrhL